MDEMGESGCISIDAAKPGIGGGGGGGAGGASDCQAAGGGGALTPVHSVGLELDSGGRGRAGGAGCAMRTSSGVSSLSVCMILLATSVECSSPNPAPPAPSGREKPEPLAPGATARAAATGAASSGRVPNSAVRKRLALRRLAPSMGGASEAIGEPKPPPMLCALRLRSSLWRSMIARVGVKAFGQPARLEAGRGERREAGRCAKAGLPNGAAGGEGRAYARGGGIACSASIQPASAGEGGGAPGGGGEAVSGRLSAGGAEGEGPSGAGVAAPGT